MRRLLPLLVAFGLSVPAWATLEIPQVSVGALVAFRTGTEALSFVGAWTPFVTLGDGYAIRGELGASLLKDSLGDLFVGLHTELYGVIPLIPDAVDWEIGGGMVFWSGVNGGLNPLLSTGFTFGVGGSMLDRVTTTYSYHFIGAGVQWFRVSVGLRWSPFDQP